MSILPVHINFAEHRERHTIGCAAKGLNLLFAARLLAQELVAREAEYGKAVFFPGFMNVFQLFILRRKATFRCHVHDEQYLALVAFQRGFLAVNGSQFGIQNIRLHSIPSG